MMNNKYILIVGSPKICWKGEGNKLEIQKDIQKLLKRGYSASSMTVLPVSGKRYHTEIGILIGALLGISGMWLYKKIKKKYGHNSE